jgi:hypothetical protein
LPDEQKDNSSWDTWFCHQDIVYECIRAFYATADADNEDVILREKRTVESELDATVLSSQKRNITYKNIINYSNLK